MVNIKTKFSDKPTCSIVSRTGISPVLSVPGWRVMNLMITFFRYSKLWMLSLRSWFFSKRRISFLSKPVCSLSLALVASLSRNMELSNKITNKFTVHTLKHSNIIYWAFSLNTMHTAAVWFHRPWNTAWMRRQANFPNNASSNKQVKHWEHCLESYRDCVRAHSGASMNDFG